MDAVNSNLSALQQRLLAPIAFVITTTAVATVYMTQPVLPAIAQAFGVSSAHAGVTFSVASAFYAGAFFIFGPLGDRLNRVLLARCALVLLAASVSLSALAASLPMLLVGMALVGLSAAAVPATMFPYVAKLAPKGKAGTYLGLILSATIVGIVLGRSLVGIVAQRAGFRGAFWMLGAAALGSAALTLLLGSPSSARRAGALSSAYVDALKLAVLPRMTLLLLVGTTLFVGYLGSITYLTLRLAGPPFNYSSGAIGWLSLTGLSAVLGAPIAGTLTHRYGLRSMVGLGMVLAIVGLASLSADTWIGVALGMTSLYLGIFATQPAMLLLVTSIAPTHATGSASSLYLLSCLAGGSLGTVALASIWGAGGWKAVTAVCLTSMLLAFGIALTQAGRAGRPAQVARA